MSLDINGIQLLDYGLFMDCGGAFEYFKSLNIKIHRILSLDLHSIELNFISGKEIRELNMKYRGIDKETDILSFSFYGDISVLQHLGMLFISYEFINEWITKRVHELFGIWSKGGWGFDDWIEKIQQVFLEHELTKLFVHGFLHLLGYQHSEEMRQLENKCLYST